MADKKPSLKGVTRPLMGVNECVDIIVVFLNGYKGRKRINAYCVCSDSSVPRMPQCVLLYAPFYPIQMRCFHWKYMVYLHGIKTVYILQVSLSVIKLFFNRLQGLSYI